MSINAQTAAAIGEKIAWGAAQRGVPLEQHRIELLCHVLDRREAPPVRKRFVCNSVQARFMAERHLLNVIPKARQHGISTQLSQIIFDECVFLANYSCGIVDRTDPEATKKLAMIRYAWEQLDKNDEPRLAELGAWIKAVNPLVRSSDHYMEWANGSSVYAATTLRGGTVNHLWITELGYIAMKDPARADEIAAGSYNTVHPGNRIDIESTHEGGRFGEFYRVIRLAQRYLSIPTEQLGPMRFRLHFFGWQDSERYRLPLAPGVEKAEVTERLANYFAKLEKAIGHKLDEEQKNWYVHKEAMTRDMARQYPGTLEEALQAQGEGSILGEEMALLRGRGRIGDATMAPMFPLFTAWDIGNSDPCCIWLLQDTGTEVIALDYYTRRLGKPGQHAAHVIQWERDYGRPVVMNYLPHDARNVTAAGTSFEEQLRQAGIVDRVVVPRTPDLWAGIATVSELLPRFRFSEACERETEDESNGNMLPSGVACLEGYRFATEAQGGAIRKVPIHDMASHGTSALRTYCEAWHQGLVQVRAAPLTTTRPIHREGPGFGPKPERVVRGIRNPR